MKRITAAALVAVALAVPAALAQRSGSSWVGGPTERGQSIVVPNPDPKDLMENVGSEIDGYGMCVDTAAETIARLLGQDQYRGFRDHFAAAEPGGNYPDGLKRQLAEWGRRKGFTPKYVQYYGPDPRPILALAQKTRRPAAVAYGYTPRYGGPAINHMVAVLRPGEPGSLSAVCDNNFPGLSRELAGRFEWMEFDELHRRMKIQANRFGRPVNGPCWVFVLLAPGLPPKPFE